MTLPLTVGLREPGGRVTIRLRIKPDEADAIERAAQGQKLTDWMIRAILAAAGHKRPGE